jgi:hypothetical protein
MTILRKCLLINIFLLVSYNLHSQNTINVFEKIMGNFEKNDFTDELIYGDFKEI